MMRTLARFRPAPARALLAVFLLATGFPAAVAASTAVPGGTISTDTTWGLLGSPYIIEGDVGVAGTDGPDGVTTLTIEPGVAVLFDGPYSLRIGTSAPGALIADADGGATIIFASNAVPPARGDWNSIRFGSETDGSSILRNVLIEHAGRANTAAGVFLAHAPEVTIHLEQITVRESGNWGVRAAGGPFTLTECTLGDNDEHDLHLGSGTGTISNCASIESFDYANQGPQIEWSGNTFNNWGARVSLADPDDVGSLSTQNTFNGVPGATLELLALRLVVRDARWSPDPGTYVTRGTMGVRGDDGPDGVTTLTLDPGVTIAFGSGHRLNVGETGGAEQPGALIADGDAAGGPATITFTSAELTPGPGDWEAIDFNGSAAPTSLLRNVRVEYAGQGVSGGAVFATSTAGGTIELDRITVRHSAGDGIVIGTGDVSLSECTLEDNAEHDIRLGNGAPTASVSDCPSIESVFYNHVNARVEWAGNTFNEWGAQVSRVDPDDVESLSTANTFNGIPGARLELRSGRIERDARWTTAPGTYVTVGDLVVQGIDGGDGVTTLTLDPGVAIAFDAGDRLRIGANPGQTSDPGALIADGNAAGGPATITFTSTAPTPAPGDWDGVVFSGSAHESSLLRNVLVEYAGAGTPEAGVRLGSITGGAIELDEITVRHSSEHGVLASQGAFSLSDCTLGDNGGADVSVSASGSVLGTVSDCPSIERVLYSGIGGQVTWTGNTFTSWGARTSSFDPDDVDSLTTANTFVPVGGAFVELLGGTIARDATWTAAAGPLELPSGTLIVQGTDGDDDRTTLRLDPGVTLRFGANAGMQVGGNVTTDPGELIADGRIDDDTVDPVTFDSAEPAPLAGDWDGIGIRTTGRVEMHEAHIAFAETGINSLGDAVVGPLAGVTVSRADTGIAISGSTLEQPLERLVFIGCDVGLQVSNAEPVIRDSELIGSTWAVLNDTPGSWCVDARQNWWGEASGPSGSPPTVGCETATPAGSGSAVSEGVLFTSWLAQLPDDRDGVPEDDGDGMADPCTGGAVVDCDDNCPEIANASQHDADGDGIGDACEALPVLRVSTDPADLPDFDNVQAAIDAARASFTRLEIFPGLEPPYFESVLVDRGRTFGFAGAQGTSESSGPVIIDGGAGPAFRVMNGAAGSPMRFADLTLRGFQGLTSPADTRVERVRFEMISDAALDLTAGSHDVRGCTVEPGVAIGARVEQGAHVDLTRTTMRQLTNAGLELLGTATIDAVLIGGGTGADGIRLGAAASAEIGYSTIADNTGVGIDNSHGGTVTVDRSIVFDNVAGDLLDVDCAAVSWSNVGTPDCSGVDDNLSLDPALDADYRLSPTSPCLEHGPAPSTYMGAPIFDADHNPRLADHDRNGLAHNDCGAFERPADGPVPGTVANVRWENPSVLTWDAEPDAAEYHVYRDEVANLSYANFGVCRDDLDADRTDTELDHPQDPALGSAFAFLITAEAGGGEEGTLGFATGAERSNFTPCP